MVSDYSGLLAALGLLVALDAVVAVGVFVVKSRAKSRYRRRSALMKRLNRSIAAADESALAAEYRADSQGFLLHLRRLLTETSPMPEQRAAIDRFLAKQDLLRPARGLLRSRRLDRRIGGYQLLGLSGKEEAGRVLLEALASERGRLGRLVALQQLATLPGCPDPSALAACLEEAPEAWRARELAALGGLAARLQLRFAEEPPPAGEAGLRLVLLAARDNPTEEDWRRLSEIAVARADSIGEVAAGILASRYAAPRFLSAFGDRPERRFRLPVARLLGGSLAPERLGDLDPWFHDPELRTAGIAAAGQILDRHPGSEPAFLDLIAGADEARAECLSLAIEHRLPAILYHSGPDSAPGIGALVARLAAAGRAGVLLESLSTPLPAAAAAAYRKALASALAANPQLASSLSRLAAPEVASGLALPPPEPEEDKAHLPLGLGDKVFLAVLVALALALFPAVFILRHLGEFPWLTPSEILYRFVFDFQFLFAFFTIAVNGSYLALLVLSMIKVTEQARLWELDLLPLFSAPEIAPSISIIAPAFNEERTIVESVHSLLSLEYPSFQVVVVNDGSKDGTLRALLGAFDLEPASSWIDATGALPTMPVRAVYRSRTLSNLVVVDKANGGKADALNAGLNRATGDYVCTIDADSVLDPQALLRAVFQALAVDREAFAVGGNVFPVNGCVVEHGHLQDISLSKEPLARFQTMEYLRSFIAGRLGWTKLGSLLIISGAFGIFRRSAVMELGGYLTGKGAYRHDTVGEDMEIVVRLTRRDKEARRGGRVEYAYNANCWTEVPETWPVLRRQRDRWHRGLMEVLCFHKTMAFRPRYGAPGLLAMPYYFIFELVGPWLETLGYLVLFIALVLNLLDPIVPLIVFSVAILFGILISVASILLAERQILYFRTGEFFRILLVAILENFGYRQLQSLGRVWTNAQFFFVSKGWQKSARQGFATEMQK